MLKLLLYRYVFTGKMVSWQRLSQHVLIGNKMTWWVRSIRHPDPRTEFIKKISLSNRLCRCCTSDHAPVLHWAGHGTLLQGLRLSGFSPLQYLLWTERLVPSWRNCTHRTVRIWKPRVPQVLVQCSHSSEIHLEKSKWGYCWGYELLLTTLKTVQ